MRRPGTGSAIEPRLREWRRHLHRHPELSFEEHETAGYVSDQLTEIGFEVHRPTATSVLATACGSRPGPAVVLRADIDALPVHERTGLPFASTVPGRMHACGHDGHAAVMLGVASLVASWSHDFAGEIRFVFQHGEERPPFGAPAVIEAGVLDDATAVLGEHLWAPLPVGKLAVLAGPTMAGVDGLRIVISGRGGHAGEPHTSVDPVAIGAQIVTNLQHLVARETSPHAPLVLSVTAVNVSSTAYNVIGDQADLLGTLRTFDDELRARAKARVESIATGIARAHRAAATVHWEAGPPPVVNDPGLARTARDVVSRAYGDDALVQLEPLMAGDDFSWYQRRVPGLYLIVGAGEPGRTPYPHHHPRFNFDERAMPVAVRVLTDLTRELLAIAQPAAV